MSGMIPQHDDLDDHHIVPDWWGREYLTNGQANTIPKMRGVVSEIDAELAKTKSRLSNLSTNLSNQSRPTIGDKKHK